MRQPDDHDTAEHVAYMRDKYPLRYRLEEDNRLIARSLKETLYPAMVYRAKQEVIQRNLALLQAVLGLELIKEYAPKNTEIWETADEALIQIEKLTRQ